MLYKLRKIGIGGSLLLWFENFLCHRRQAVKIGGTISSFDHVSSGVAQGTILGPILFILYMDGVSDILFSSSLKLYADDAKLYRATSTAYQCDLLQSDLTKLEHFFS